MATIAFAAPILPGKTEAWQKMMEEINGPSRGKYEDQKRRQGMKRELMYLQQTPMGDMAVYVIEADDLAAVMGLVGASTNPYDRWTRDQILDVHGMDMAQPPSGPMSELKLEYSA